MNKEVLTRAIQSEEIEWRVQGVTGKGIDKAKTIIVPYITNRCVMERLDEAFGFDHWSSEFKETSTGFICRITIAISEPVKVDTGNSISPIGYSNVKYTHFYKEDGADKTKIEATKGGISDSMKRCAVQFGIGRGLYKYPRVMIKGEVKYISDAIRQRLDNMVDAINKGTFNKQVVTL